MSRVDRSRKPVRLKPGQSLERLEERQLLSTVPVSISAAMPVAQPSVQPGQVIPYSSGSDPYAVYSPSQVRTAYGVNTITDQGQGMTIAIVDAYSQPYIQSDVNEFSSLFGLPQMDGVGGDPTLSVLVPTGQSTPPPANTVPGNWGYEISLDVEWVHSIAPYANIDLVTCQNNSGDSLFGAEVDGQPYSSGDVYAKSLPGVSVVSNSYGLGEFNGETNYDTAFSSSSVAFTFSTGDGGAPGGYPAYSPNVIAVGGTSLYTKSIKGKYGSESGWSGSGGGISKYESTPSFQSSNGVNYGARSIPDVSWLADPDTGVYLLDSLDAPGEILEYIGGTSLASPMWAGLIAIGDQERGSAGSLNSQGVLDSLYGAYDSSSYDSDFHDITTGNNGFAAGPGYDLVTGIGSPQAPAIATLLGGASPGVKIGGPVTTNAVRSSNLSKVYFNPEKAVYAPPVNPITVGGASAAVGSIDFLTTIDIPKGKKIGSTL